MNSITLYTSSMFAISSIYAYYRSNPILYCCVATLITSIAFHSTKNNVLRYLDMITVHTSMIYGIYVLMVHHIYFYISIAITVYMAVLYYYCRNESELWHSSMHIFGNIGIILAIEAYYQIALLRKLIP